VTEAAHVPVLLGPLLAACAPVRGVWLDGTFGAGGYARGLIAAGADRVLGVDRDPEAGRLAAAWLPGFQGRIELHSGSFGELDRIAAAAGAVPLDGVVLDLGLSSMQIDDGARGFSFLRDGPLDMRMAQAGTSAAELVNGLSPEALAELLEAYGEERAARRIARALVAARPLTTTLELAQVVARCLPRPKPGERHPATRTFQALRIAVNDELGELARGLMAAERALAPGGLLAVVSFHSLEDRMVKRFLQIRGGRRGGPSRHQPEAAAAPPAWEAVTRKAIEPDAEEVAGNPRARSARLRVARRTAAAAARVDPAALGLPTIATRLGGGAEERRGARR
jgi:16S rRNA (cytosine1402-N4)-methyltransferase